MSPVQQWTERTELRTVASEVYGFTTIAELQFLAWFLETQFSGRGAAVELGSALGRSTIAILDGLSRNPRAASARLHVYDLFRFDWWLLEQYRKLPDVDASGLEIGSSFEEIFRRNLGARVDRAALHVGDISTQSWSGGPIEFLFVDIMKDWTATRAVIEQFFPALEPGLAVVVHQDYKHPFAPQIPLTMYRLRDYFEPLWSVCGSGISASVAFRCVRRLDANALRRLLDAGLCDLDSYTIGEIDAAIDHALVIVAGDPEGEVTLLKAARTVIFADLLAARPEFTKLASGVDLMRVLIQDRMGPFFEDSVFDAAKRAELEEKARSVAEIERIVALHQADLESLRAVRAQLAEIHGSRAWRWIDRYRRVRRGFGL